MVSSVLRLYPYFAIVAAIVILVAIFWIRARRKSPEQRERERRLRIAKLAALRTEP